MEKKNIDWGSIGFGYIPTDYRYVANFKDGKWDEGQLTTDPNVTLNECACVFQYAQTVFEGMKAYTTEDGKIVVFRPDLNAARMADSARRLEMPVFSGRTFSGGSQRSGKSQCSVCASVWFRGNTLYSPIHVWKQSGHRSQAGR